MTRSGLGRVAVLAAIAISISACTGAESSPSVGVDRDRAAAPSIELVSFADVGGDVGLDFRHGAFRWDYGGDPAAMMGGGVCWIDYDRDGWFDLFAVNTWSDGEWARWQDEGGPPTSRLFRNEEGTFVDVSADTGSALEVRGNGCVAADLDGDGWTDLYVTTDRANVLLWNDAGQGFVDGSAESGADAYGWHSGAAAGDVNGDGWVDLFVAGYADPNRPIPEATKGFPNSFEPEPDLLFLNEGPVDGARPQFREVGADVGLEPTRADYGLGAVLSDVDGDRDLDLFVANDTNPNRLYLNAPGGPAGLTFVEVGADAAVDDDNAGMGVAAADYSGDGLPDISVTNMGEQIHNVFRSVGQASFVDARAEMGQPELGAGLTGWGASWADVDLDTDLDLVLVHGGIPVTGLPRDQQQVQLFENRTFDGETGVFRDSSAVVGLDSVGTYVGRGSAAADYDNDGDVDLVVGTVGGELALLRNSGAGGHWLLVAPAPAVPGTVVTVTLADGSLLRRELLAGSSYLSSEDPRLHFGLGTAEQVESLTVAWPDGAEASLTAVAADQILAVTPG